MRPDELRQLKKESEKVNAFDVSCGNCLYWVQGDRDLGGECRYYPPRAMVLEKVEVQREYLEAVSDVRDCYEHERADRFVAIWPKTHKYEWCGHWEPRLEGQAGK